MLYPIHSPSTRTYIEHQVCGCLHCIHLSFTYLTHALSPLFSAWDQTHTTDKKPKQTKAHIVINENKTAKNTKTRTKFKLKPFIQV